MKINGLLNTCLLVLVPLSTLPAHAQSSKGLTDLVWTAVKTELAAAQDDNSVFLYRDHDRKPTNDVVRLVVETTSHGSVSRILERNGNPIPLQQQRTAVENFVNNPALQLKQRRDNQHDDQQATELLKMIPVGFLWSITSENAREITLSYRPNPNFDPPTMEARVFAAMAGEMVVDRQQYRIKTFKGRLIHDVTFGWGLFGRLSRGGTFDVERRELKPHVWEIVETHVHITGHALFFKSIGDEEDDVESDFRPAPQNTSLQEAAQLLLGQPEN
jgi:hypothetical protein